MSNRTDLETSFPVLHSQSLFLMAAVYWVYGVYSTFAKGAIPGIDWTTDHNYILGVAWTLVVGSRARVPLISYINICRAIAMLGRGYFLLPVLFLNTMIQAYSWILLVVVWFHEPIPLPLIRITGGFKTGAIMLALIVPVLALLNFISAKYLLRLKSNITPDKIAIETD